MNNNINLLSDTITRPTEAMLKAMFSAEVGDDVYKEDPTVNHLEAFASQMFGYQAALFCPSGTMTNQIAIRIHTSPFSQVICSKIAHIHLFEGGGIGGNSGATTALLDGEYGFFTASQVESAIQSDANIHHSPTSLIAVENTTNVGGGRAWDIQELHKIKQVAKKHNIPFHCDGARILNACVATNTHPKEFSKIFDTMSVCLSKGLGAPVGSLLLGSEEHIYKATRIRKAMGGGMRQAGYLAAAGLFALQNNVERLSEDHLRAKYLAEVLRSLDYVSEVIAPQTNILIFHLNGVEDQVFISALKEKGILIQSVGKGLMRMVTHLDFTQEMMLETEKILKSLKF